MKHCVHIHANVYDSYIQMVVYMHVLLTCKCHVYSKPTELTEEIVLLTESN